MTENLELKKAASWLKQAKSVTVLTGAGVSQESGIPTFRGASGEGLWEKYNPMELATPEAFEKDPELVWRWYEYRRDLVRNARPNAGHYSLARLENLLPSLSLITQNVDDLHQRAGSRNITRLHGNLFEARGTQSSCVIPLPDPLREIPPHQEGEMLRPNIVWFGESLDSKILARAFDAARQAEVLLVIGTSLQVYPAALILPLALESGARVIEINPFPSRVPGTMVLEGTAAKILPALEAELI